jgi:hypothetical protein
MSRVMLKSKEDIRILMVAEPVQGDGTQALISKLKMQGPEPTSRPLKGQSLCFEDI